MNHNSLHSLWQLAVEQHIPYLDDTSFTADGAEWIWNLALDLFPDSLQIVDWFHASQPLHQAAAALFPDDPERANRRFTHRQDDLFQGAAASIALELECADLPDYARYFRVHQRRMQYQTFREEGYPIGSGTVESAIKQFKSRLSAAGMRCRAPLLVKCSYFALRLLTILSMPVGLLNNFREMHPGAPPELAGTPLRGSPTSTLESTYSSLDLLCAYDEGESEAAACQIDAHCN